VAEIPFKFGTRSGGKSKADGMTAVRYLVVAVQALARADLRREDTGRR